MPGWSNDGGNIPANTQGLERAHWWSFGWCYHSLGGHHCINTLVETTTGIHTLVETATEQVRNEPYKDIRWAPLEHRRRKDQRSIDSTTLHRKRTLLSRPCCRQSVFLQLHDSTFPHGLSAGNPVWPQWQPVSLAPQNHNTDQTL